MDRQRREHHAIYLNTKASVPLTEQKREAIKTAYGQSIAIMGKTESHLMVGLEENVPLYFGGEKQEKCALVDARVFGEVDPDKASGMTELICRTLDMILAFLRTRSM